MLRYLTLALLIPINAISAIEHYELYKGLDKLEIQAITKSNETYLIAYDSILIAINCEEIDSIELSKEDLKGAIASLRQAVSTFKRKPYAADIESFLNATRYLHMILIEPIEKNLKFKLNIIADKSMTRIPWNSLLSADGSYLIDDHQITLVREGCSDNRAAKALRHHKVHMIAPSFKGPLALRTAEEKKVLEGLWPNAKEEMSSSSIIHVSSHSFIDSTSWTKSGILLPNGEVMSNNEITKMNLDGSLVFLNICAGADGVSGQKSILDAFHEAGAENLIAALWDIEDQMAISIASYFYENLISGQSISEALRNGLLTYKQVMSEAGQFNPVYWSAYQYYGIDKVLVKKSKRTLKQLSSIALPICTSFSVFIYYFGSKIKNKILDYNLV